MIERAKNAQVLTLGKGEIVVAHGFHEGYPCLWFSPAEKPGEVGEPALNEPMIGAFCLRFGNIDAINDHLERVVRMVEDLEAALKAQENAK